MVRKIISFLVFPLMSYAVCHGEKVINIPPVSGDATPVLQKALEEASMVEDENVVIRLTPGVYNLSRDKSSRQIYYISNTASRKENPDPTKHIGLWFRNLKNVTLDGNGAKFLTHGEMTSFAIDNCRNIRLKNFQLDASDPSVVEITIIKTGDDFIEFEVVAPSKFEIENEAFNFIGEGWKFGDSQKDSEHVEFAQIYDRNKGRTYRVPSPLTHYKKAVKIGGNRVRIYFDHKPQFEPGERYQIRHGVRNEVCAFINESKDISLDSLTLYFMGNFGIVSQFTENLTFTNLICEPNPETDRTNAGFADFLQFSSCKGLIQVSDSRFNGSQDDPINIHGTHLKVDSIIGNKKIIISYRHPQTYGFMPFHKGDKIAFVNPKSLNYEGCETKVMNVAQLTDYSYEIELEEEISQLGIGQREEGVYVVENLSYTPDVIIRNNYFALTPARGVLISTRGKSLIEGNTFKGIPMASILVADDASSWYESGPVSDLTIRDNVFLDCSLPVISILPEIKEFKQPVHSGIKIEKNRFSPAGENTIDIYASDNVVIRDNIFETEKESQLTLSDMINLREVTHSTVSDNKIVKAF